MQVVTVKEILDREFLTIRSRLLDLAAALDRVERADGKAADDARWRQIQLAIAVIGDSKGDRAERSQLAFSLPYADDWQRDYGVR